MGGNRVDRTAGPGDLLQFEPHVTRLAEHAAGDLGAGSAETLLDRRRERPVHLRVSPDDEYRTRRGARLQDLTRDRGAGPIAIRSTGSPSL